MIIQLDAKGLEIVCGAYLSQDEVLMKELIDGVDIHSRNQKMLGLPEGKDGRLVAKIFVFRLMYGGGAWGYAMILHSLGLVLRGSFGRIRLMTIILSTKALLSGTTPL